MTNLKNILSHKKTSFLLLTAAFVVGIIFSSAYFSSIIFAEEENETDQCAVEICNPEEELVTNGSFENPIVGTPQQWDIYSNSGIGWLIEWVLPSENPARPTNALLELQAGVNGWLAQDGSQYAELDSDWDGPSGSLNGEPASVKIYQDIPTIPGQNYNIEFYFSPRPGTDEANNQLEFSWDGIVRDTISGTGDSNTNWTLHSYKFNATGATTRLQFSDMGASDSLGTFLDNVSVKCEGGGQQECIPEGGSHAVVPGAPSCCEGLREIPCDEPDQSGNCTPGCTGAVYCTLCGNGICGLGENKCNCPEDCNVPCENVVVVSNTDNDVFDTSENPLGKAVLTWNLHSAWTAAIDGADWIWKTYYVENPEQNETYVFSKSFDIVGTVSSANLKIAADNTFKVWINNVFVGQDLTEYNYNHVSEYDVDYKLQSGENTIKFEVMNMALAGSNAESNPAGLLYKLEVERSSCEPQCTDLDQDTYSTQGGDCGPVDCNDDNAEVNPGATENCSNQIDDDCDGLVDAADPDCPQVGCQPEATRTCETTQPGICSSGTQTCTELAVWGGCVPTNSPTTEICGNGIDEDCNGADPTCPLVGPPTLPPAGGGGGGGIILVIFNERIESVLATSATVSWLTNLPATSRVVYDTIPHSPAGSPPNYGYALSTLENSNKVTGHNVTITGLTPGLTYYWRAISHTSPGEAVGNELPFTLKTTECDQGDTQLCSTGKSGICSAGTVACGQNGLWGECAQNVEATAENCTNGLDDDCDGLIDFADPNCRVAGATTGAGCTDYYNDSDADGYGISDNKQCLTAAGGDYTATQGGDCDDTKPEIRPDATEICDNQVDDNCNGKTDCADDSCADKPQCTGQQEATTGETQEGQLGGVGLTKLLAGIGDNLRSMNICWLLPILLAILLILLYLMRKGYKKEDERSWWLLGGVAVIAVILLLWKKWCLILLVPIALIIILMVLDYIKKRKGKKPGAIL